MWIIELLEIRPEEMILRRCVDVELRHSDDWMKKYMKMQVGGVKPLGRPKIFGRRL